MSGAVLRLGGAGGGPSLAALLAGGLAAAVALSTDDAAHALLEAQPVSLRRRALARVALVSPPAVAGWLVCIAVGGASTVPSGGVGVPAFVALAGTGVAAAVVVQRRRPDVAAAAGAAVVLAWAFAPIVFDRGMVGDAAGLWARHPAPVLVGVCAAFLVGSRR